MHAHCLTYLLLALPLFCVGGVVAPEDLPRHQAMWLAILDACRAANLTPKDFCAYTRISQQRYSQMERGEGHILSLTRLMLLPDEFWYALLPSLAFIVTRRRVSEIRQANQQERKRA